MEIKNMHGKLIAAALFLFLCQALFAQEDGYYIEYNNDKPKFIQRLVWQKEEHAWQYEVLIHVLDNGYREYSRNTTRNDVLLVSLPPGKYRYTVTPFDLLGHRGEPSEWKDFEVLPAFQPMLSDFVPEVFYLDRIQDRILRITGANFLEESEIFLQNDTDSLYPETLIIVDDKSATLIFDDMKLIPGSYNIFVKNPGGLSTLSGEFVVGYRKPLDFFLKMAYVPLIPLYEENIVVENPALSLAGMFLSFEVISSKRGDINGGLELAASVNYFDPGIVLQLGNSSTNPPTAEKGTLYTALDLNVVLQKRFNRGRMALSFRFGVSGSIVSDLETAEENKTTVNGMLNLGVGYLVRLYKVFYLETGLDFRIDVSANYPTFLKPRLGIAWQF